ncbi:hypothetical protein GCM10009765_84200 [Fodinicola feengrottensis]|uniref:Uncharacterized protein n=1 Tax=Fodinicola feengrottensis TaxID=435914 RepID=A0ABN2JDH8_9ACTN
MRLATATDAAFSFQRPGKPTRPAGLAVESKCIAIGKAQRTEERHPTNDRPGQAMAVKALPNECDKPQHDSYQVTAENKIELELIASWCGLAAGYQRLVGDARLRMPGTPGLKEIPNPQEIGKVEYAADQDDSDQ